LFRGVFMGTRFTPGGMAPPEFQHHSVCGTKKIEADLSE
jgi:hypothetical protein